jgi:hypothetical protein
LPEIEVVSPAMMTETFHLNAISVRVIVNGRAMDFEELSVFTLSREPAYGFTPKTDGGLCNSGHSLYSQLEPSQGLLNHVPK